jgi:hypothetical protein
MNMQAMQTRSVARQTGVLVRLFNANAKAPLTTEQIAAGIEKNRKFRKFNDQSCK